MYRLLIACLALFTVTVTLAEETPLADVKLDWSKLSTVEMGFQLVGKARLTSAGKPSGSMTLKGMFSERTEIKGDQVLIHQTRDMFGTHFETTIACANDSILSIQSGNGSVIMANGMVREVSFELKDGKIQAAMGTQKREMEYLPGTVNDMAIFRMVQLLPHTPMTYTFDLYSSGDGLRTIKPKEGQAFSLQCVGPAETEINGAKVATTQFDLHNNRKEPVSYFVDDKGTILKFVPDPSTEMIAVTAEELATYRAEQKKKLDVAIAARKLAESQSAATKAIPHDKVVAMVKALMPDSKVVADTDNEGLPFIDKSELVVSADSRVRVRVCKLKNIGFEKAILGGGPAVVQNGVYVICGDYGNAVAEPLNGQIQAGWQALLPAEK